MNHYEMNDQRIWKPSFSHFQILLLKFSLKELSESIKKIENQMYKYAKDMEFEKAAWCRDKMKYLKGKMIDI